MKALQVLKHALQHPQNGVFSLITLCFVSRARIGKTLSRSRQRVLQGVGNVVPDRKPFWYFSGTEKYSRLYYFARNRCPIPNQTKGLETEKKLIHKDVKPGLYPESTKLFRAKQLEH